MTLVIVFLRFLVAVVFTFVVTSGQEVKAELEREEPFLQHLMGTSHGRLATAEKSWPVAGDVDGFSSSLSRRRRSVISSGISADNRAMLIKAHNDRRRQVQPAADDMLFMVRFSYLVITFFCLIIRLPCYPVYSDNNETI